MFSPFRWITPILNAANSRSRALFLGLFTVEHHVIVHSVGKVTAAKFDEVFKKTRVLFVD
jgi:hypothetical protein